MLNIEPDHCLVNSGYSFAIFIVTTVEFLPALHFSDKQWALHNIVMSYVCNLWIKGLLPIYCIGSRPKWKIFPNGLEPLLQVLI